MGIDFYFDFASPHGFIAAMRIDTLAGPVTWRPFLLGAVYKRFGQSPLEHPLKRDYVMNVDAPRMARQIGLELKVPAGFPEHALPPSRAFYWIEPQDPAKPEGPISRKSGATVISAGEGMAASTSGWRTWTRSFAQVNALRGSNLPRPVS